MNRRIMTSAALAIAASLPLGAQSAPDLAGHWEGVVQAPEMMVDVHVDIARDSDGRLVGAISLPGERLTGLPLATVTMNGAEVSFSARSDQPFAGTMSSDGLTIAGEFSMAGGSVPFRLTRSGEPRSQPRATSPPISERLAGTWNATITGRRGEIRVIVTLANQPDGRATGSLVNVDEGGLELPLTIEESAEVVTLRTTPVDSSFSGALDADGTVLDGTDRQGAQSVAVTFRRAAK